MLEEFKEILLTEVEPESEMFIKDFILPFIKFVELKIEMESDLGRKAAIKEAILALPELLKPCLKENIHSESWSFNNVEGGNKEQFFRQ